MQDLVNELARRLKSPVKDETALKGKFDFVMNFRLVD
jgi:uncharacterized protein (TIGR03435 family)